MSKDRHSSAYDNVPTGDSVFPRPEGYSGVIPRREPQVKEVIPDGAIVPADDGSFVVNGWKMTQTGLIPPEHFTRDDWNAVVEQIKKLTGVMQWVIGDLLNIGVDYGVTYQEFAEATGYEVKTLYNLKSIAAKVKMAVRFPAPLTLAHHAEVASLTPDEQYNWLKWAYDEQISVKNLREQIRGKSTKTVDKLESAYNTALKSLQFLEKNADREQRRMLAAQLRELADRLEK